MSPERRLPLAVAGAVVVVIAIVVVGALALGGDDVEVTERPGETEGPAETETATAPGGEEAVALFTDNCGTCHTLAAAGTTATVGPNLDDLRFTEQRVLAAIEEGPGIMSPNILEGEDAELVARLVAEQEPTLGEPPAPQEGADEDTETGEAP